MSRFFGLCESCSNSCRWWQEIVWKSCSCHSVNRRVGWYSKGCTAYRFYIFSHWWMQPLLGRVVHLKRGVSRPFFTPRLCGDLLASGGVACCHPGGHGLWMGSLVGQCSKHKIKNSTKMCTFVCQNIAVKNSTGILCPTSCPVLCSHFLLSAWRPFFWSHLEVETVAHCDPFTTDWGGYRQQQTPCIWCYRQARSNSLGHCRRNIDKS